jgi:hypothetical protein
MKKLINAAVKKVRSFISFDKMKKLGISAIQKVRFCLALVIALPLWFFSKLVKHKKAKNALASAALWLMYGDKVSLSDPEVESGADNVACE